MPPSPARSASTLASTGAPAARAVAARRATSPGLADGSRPRLLSPQATRSRRAPAGRARLSLWLARNRSSTGPTTPVCTNATLAAPPGAGGGRHTQNPAAARGRAAATAAASTRAGPAMPGRRTATTARLTATSRNPTAQTPPRAATDSSAGAFHWLAPSSPQGPPRPSQDRTASPTTNAAGTSTRAAASRPGVGPGGGPGVEPGVGPGVGPGVRPGVGPDVRLAVGPDVAVGPVDNPAPAIRGWATLPVGAPAPDTGRSGCGTPPAGGRGSGGAGMAAAPSRARASQPTGSQQRPSSMARGTMNGPTTGNRKALTARKKPVPPSHARTPASGPEGAAMARASSGASPTRASHHQPGRGKARASGAPSPTASSRPPHRPAGAPGRPPHLLTGAPGRPPRWTSGASDSPPHLSTGLRGSWRRT